MAEIEINVLSRQWLAQRIPDAATLHLGVVTLVAVRNEEKLTTGMPWELYPLLPEGLM